MNKLTIATLVLSLCALAPVPGTATEITLQETSWQLERYLDDAGETASVLPDTTVDITFGDGELGGSAGCNRYFGAYELGGDHEIRFPSPMGSTQMACAPPVAEQEQRYLALLAQAALWEIESDQLTLFDSDRQALLQYIAIEPPTLENTDWQATGINNGKGGVVSTASTNLSTVTFAEGTVSGSGGCNQFNAAYEVKENQIAIGPAAATRKFCGDPEGIMEQEQQFFAALERARTYTLTPGKLELRDEDGSLQAGFQVAPQPQ